MNNPTVVRSKAPDKLKCGALSSVLRTHMVSITEASPGKNIGT